MAASSSSSSSGSSSSAGKKGGGKSKGTEEWVSRETGEEDDEDYPTLLADIARLSPKELATLIDSEDSSYKIVDVRDSEVSITGHTLRHALHYPSSTFSRDIEYIRQSLVDYKVVIFHCAYSQVRGPMCANQYYQLIHADHHADPASVSDSDGSTVTTTTTDQRVCLLDGGFNEFALFYPFSEKRYEDRYYDKIEKSSASVLSSELQEYEYLEGSELCRWMDNEEMNGRFSVIDVRDDDFGPHCIRGAQNCPEFTLQYNPADRSMSDGLVQLFEQTKEHDFVVFHCMYSMSRGPRAAKSYLRARMHCFEVSKHRRLFRQKVFVLRHGFRGFYKIFPSYCVRV